MSGLDLEHPQRIAGRLGDGRIGILAELAELRFDLPLADVAEDTQYHWQVFSGGESFLQRPQGASSGSHEQHAGDGVDRGVSRAQGAHDGASGGVPARRAPKRVLREHSSRRDQFHQSQFSMA